MKRLISQSDIAGIGGCVRVGDTSDGYVGYNRRALMSEQIKNIRVGQMNVIVLDTGVIIGIVDKVEGVVGGGGTPGVYFTDKFTAFDTEDGTWTTYAGSEYYLNYDEGMDIEPRS